MSQDLHTLVDLPEEDSSDLTDEEIAHSVEAGTPEALADYLLGTVKCLTCGGKVAVTQHQLRRRAPSHYARTLFVCQDGHHGSVTFRVGFLGGT